MVVVVVAVAIAVVAEIVVGVVAETGMLTRVAEA